MTRKPLFAPEARAGILFLVPAMTLITIFYFLPVIAGFALSLTDFDIYSLGTASNTRIVGLTNYRELLHSVVFWQSLRNTLYFSHASGAVPSGTIQNYTFVPGAIHAQPGSTITIYNDDVIRPRSRPLVRSTATRRCASKAASAERSSARPSAAR